MPGHCGGLLFGKVKTGTTEVSRQSWRALKVSQALTLPVSKPL